MRTADNKAKHLLITMRPPREARGTEIRLTELRNIGCVGSVEKFRDLEQLFSCRLRVRHRSTSEFPMRIQIALRPCSFAFLNSTALDYAVSQRSARNPYTQISSATALPPRPHVSP